MDVPSSQISLSGIWTWFNDPRAVYDSVNDVLYYAAVNNAGTVRINAWDFTNLHFRSAPISTTSLGVDDHNNPALLLLASGKILAAYSEHNGDSYSRRATTAGEIDAWETEVHVNAPGTSGVNNSYAQL